MHPPGYAVALWRVGSMPESDDRLGCSVAASICGDGLLDSLGPWYGWGRRCCGRPRCLGCKSGGGGDEAKPGTGHRETALCQYQIGCELDGVVPNNTHSGGADPENDRGWLVDVEPRHCCDHIISDLAISICGHPVGRVRPVHVFLGKWGAAT